MTKSRKTYFQGRKKENFYKEAKKIDVRARSYFKLEQLDNKFNLILNDKKIIDLGAAPGGWLEYIDKKITKGQLVGIDLLEIKRHQDFSEKVQIIQDNFDNILDYKLGQFDLVLSDMAPEFSGDAFLDKGKTHKLNLKTIEFCNENLIRGGNLLFKTFEGEDLDHVRNTARKMFNIVKDFKPLSSQKKSSEVFILCLNKK